MSGGPVNYAATVARRPAAARRLFTDGTWPRSRVGASRHGTRRQANLHWCRPRRGRAAINRYSGDRPAP